MGITHGIYYGYISTNWNFQVVYLLPIAPSVRCWKDLASNSGNRPGWASAGAVLSIS